MVIRSNISMTLKPEITIEHELSPMDATEVQKAAASQPRKKNLTAGSEGKHCSGWRGWHTFGS